MDITKLEIMLFVWVIALIIAIFGFGAKFGQIMQANVQITESGKEQIKEVIKYVERDIHSFYIRYDVALLKNESDIVELDNITITSYNNEAEQTDDTPHIMASNRIVYEGAIAISRDLKSKYKLKYGDIVEIFNDYYIIEDLMNERYKNRIDIFYFSKDKSKSIHYKNQKIKIFRLKR